VAPTPKLTEAGLTVTVFTGAGGAAFTVICGVVVPIVSLVAVIVAVPTPTAVTVIVAPLPMLTDVVPLSASTAGSLETQLTVRPESVAPPASFGAAVRT
jgi:hypothetical protein